MKKHFLRASVSICLAACGAHPDELDEPVAESTGAITIPDDPLFPRQWGLRNTGQLVPWTTFEGEQTFLVAGVRGVDINMPLAWDTTQGSSDVLVGIAETEGVDIDHEDLRDQIFRNRGEIAADGIDNDGNGCVDDDRGCDFVDGDGVYDPLTDHATHVSGIAGARIKNGKGVAGVAPKVKLVPLTSEVQNETFIAAIDYAQANGIRVINCSQGSHTDAFFNPAVRAAMAAADVLFVCSGGNRGTPRLNFPSSYPGANILSVANVTNIGELSDHSTYGSDHVDIAAPGRSILSTVPGNDYLYDDGTSQAAPHVAGVAALVMKKFPNLSVVQVADRLKRTAMRMTTLNGMVGAGGMVDARAALEDVSPIQLGATSASRSIRVSWSAQPGATRYDIERDGTVVNAGAGTSHVHGGLAVDSGHIYRVRAIVGSRTGAWSHRLMAKASLMPTSEPFVLQSPHPYPNGFSQGYVVTKPGATRLRVHFSRVDALPGDVIEYLRSFQDERESIDEQISGDYPNGFWTHWLDGDRFEFQFSTDAAGTALGFSVDRIEYFR
jgi:subtilisin family serine protease